MEGSVSGKRTFKICFVSFLFVSLFLTLFFSNIHRAQSTSGKPTQSEFETPRQVLKNVLNVTVWVYLTGSYRFFDLNVHHEIMVDITSNLTMPPTSRYSISTMIPFALTDITVQPPSANYTLGFWGYPPTAKLDVSVPANTSYSSIRLRAYISGSSVFWRNTAEIQFLSAAGPGSVSYALVIVPPPTSEVRTVYSIQYPNLTRQEVASGERRYVIVSEPHSLSPVVTLYEHKSWETNAVILMVVTVFLVFAIPYALSSRFSVMLSRFIAALRRLPRSKLNSAFRRLRHEISKLDSKKFLAVYILCALLMTSLSFSAGPDPRLKVYILASTPRTAGIISDFVHATTGAVSVTFFEEMGEFELLTNLGVFSAVIIGDFYYLAPTKALVKSYIYPAFDSIPRIILLQGVFFGDTQVSIPKDFSTEIESRYLFKTTSVKDLAALVSVLLGLARRTNALGLNVSPYMYLGVAALVGSLSFILVFFSMAFLASRLIETGKKPAIVGFSEAIAYSLAMFFFTQTIYTVCTVLLAMPLGLHTSVPKVTAIGFFGFGGGSRPRMLSGLVGFLFGALVSLKEGVRPDKGGFVIFLVMSFFILIDPWTGGIIFYEFVLLFTVGPGMEYAYTSWSYVRMFLGAISSAFGGWISPVYGISTGVMLYYVGAISFSLYAKVKKSTATVLLLFSAFCISDGGIRVADMNPWRSIASLIPGVIAGFFFVAIFWLLSFAETIIREKFGAGKRFA